MLPISRADPGGPINGNFCMIGFLADLMNYAKCQVRCRSLQLASDLREGVSFSLYHRKSKSSVQLRSNTVQQVLAYVKDFGFGERTTLGLSHIFIYLFKNRSFEYCSKLLYGPYNIAWCNRAST